MTKLALIEEWWQETEAGDQSMEDDHQPFWDDVIENVIDADFTGKKLLDFGCNQGGMLRRIYRSAPFREAVGIDLAQKSVAQANARKGNLPIIYMARATLDGLDQDFDYATSTAVIYLVRDIADHARQIFDRLKPGGVYFATHPDYAGDPRYKVTQKIIDDNATVKCSSNTMDEIIAGFESAGFQVFVKRMLPKAYMSVSAQSDREWYGSSANKIHLWYEHRYAFRCVKPA